MEHNSINPAPWEWTGARLSNIPHYQTVCIMSTFVTHSFSAYHSQPSENIYSSLIFISS